MPSPEQVVTTAFSWLPAIVLVAFVVKYTTSLIQDMFRDDE